jgi:hypothetical protein
LALDLASLSGPTDWGFRGLSKCPSEVEVLAQALSQTKRSDFEYRTARESFRYLGPSPRIRPLAKKLALILRKPAASLGVKSSESEPAIGFAPFPELLFISEPHDRAPGGVVYLYGPWEFEARLQTPAP